MKLGKVGKRIIIGVGVVVFLLGLAFVYLNYRNRTLSPPGEAELTNGNLTVRVDYSRPSVRDRLIFGSESSGALQPWGQYWRLGANESTEITFNQDVSFNGQNIEKGQYKMYAIPGKLEFEIVLNTSLGDWGYSEADHSFDVLSTKIPVIQNELVEQHTISLDQSGDGIIVVVEFSDVRLEIPVRPAP